MISQRLTGERVQILEPNANLDLTQGPSPNVVRLLGPSAPGETFPVISVPPPVGVTTVPGNGPVRIIDHLHVDFNSHCTDIPYSNDGMRTNN